MGQLKFKPQTNVLALKVARAWQGDANGRGEAKTNGHRPGATEAGLELTPQRLELVKAYAKNALRHAQAPSASQIAQRFAPRAEEAPPLARLALLRMRRRARRLPCWRRGFAG